MPVSIWAGGAALAAAEKKPAETVTLQNQLLLGKTFSYCTLGYVLKRGFMILIKIGINIQKVFCKCCRR
jgi:hypothetical protein